MTSRRASRRDGHRPRPTVESPAAEVPQFADPGPIPGPDEWVSTVVGWCDGEENLEVAKVGTHDILIDLMGDSRTGGVFWQLYRVQADALQILDIMSVDADRAALQHYNELRRLLIDDGGILVVAIAPGIRPL